MSYSAYEIYKGVSDSMVGEIPNNWNLIKIKHVVDTKISDGPHETPPLQDSGIPFLSAEAVKNNRLDFSKKRGYISEKLHKQYCKKVKPQKDDLFIVKSGATTGNIAKVETDEEFSIWSPLALIRTNLKAYSEFTYYYLQSVYFRMQVELNWSYGTQENIGMGVLENLFIPIPPYKEQTQIATFLDRETQKIDRLIEKQQQLIKLLQEKRQAVISHAVTKGLPAAEAAQAGLNPNVKMKDSGVEWLGEIPEHWMVKRLKHISPRIGVGLVINPSTYTTDEGVYFIFGGDVKEFGFDLSKTRRIKETDSNKLHPSKLSTGDLISVRVGYPGITAVVTDELDGANCASVIIIRKGRFNSHWLCAAMNAAIGKYQVDMASYGAAQKQYNVSDAVEFWFPVPPDNEQGEIADYVHVRLKGFHRILFKVKDSIRLLKERRTALISAAVTGKIDVRSVSNG